MSYITCKKYKGNSNLDIPFIVLVTKVRIHLQVANIMLRFGSKVQSLGRSYSR